MCPDDYDKYYYLKQYLFGVVTSQFRDENKLNAFDPAEVSIARIKTIRVRNRGFCNKTQFANAIYFHLVGLDLYPAGVVTCKLLHPIRGRAVYLIAMLGRLRREFN